MKTMILEDEFQELKVMVKAAEEEVVMAVMFHETWKPSAYDKELHIRMGNSFATHAFQIIRQSLRREMLIALTRLWDTNKDKFARPIRMTLISEKLRREDLFEYIVSRRASKIGLSEYNVSSIRDVLEPNKNAVVQLVQKYSQGGAGFEILNKIRKLRNERLAHRQTALTKTIFSDPTDNEIEAFYADNLELVRLLLSLILATSFDLNEVAEVYRHHAKYFWVNAKGERTEGHPNFRPLA